VRPPVRIGVHAFVFAAGRSARDYARVAAGARAAGFSLVEVPLLDAVGIAAGVLRRALEAEGLGLTCSAGMTAAADISAEDPAVAAAGEQLLLRAVRLAAALGSPCLTGVLYGPLGAARSPPSRAARARCVDILRRSARTAQVEGVTLGIEPVNRYESSVANTAAQAAALVAEIAEPNVMVHLDAFHMNIEEESMAGAVEDADDLLGYVHVAESHRGYLGTGSADLQGLFDALVATGYEGPIVFEAFTRSRSAGELARPLALWRDVWTSAGDVAVHAERFIAAGLERAGRSPRA
jgi:D-psicose/D-tagatose/L-ribulose 3-epimerase